MANRYQQNTYQGGRRYPYPSQYSYYPNRQHPYHQNSKPWYPLLVVLAGILLIGFGFMSVDQIDSQIARRAAANPDQEIAAVIFCDPCTAVEGESVAEGKVFVVDTALNVKQMANLPGVKQIQLLGSVS